MDDILKIPLLKEPPPNPCKCVSYNQPQDWQTDKTISLDPRQHFKDFTKTADIDACIAPVIKRLWLQGVKTLASCCGHNKRVKSVIVEESQIEKAVRLVCRFDSVNEWQVSYNDSIGKFHSVFINKGAVDTNKSPARKYK